MLVDPQVLARYMPSGAPDSAPAAVLGAAGAGFNTVGTYLRSETQTDQLNALRALQMAGIDAQATQAVNGADAGALVAVARARLLRDAANATTSAQQQTARQAIESLDRASPPPTSESSGGVVVPVLLATGVVGATVAMLWWTTKRD